MSNIKYTIGDLLNSKQQGLVNTVNLNGLMGKGIAYQFKKKFPLNYEAYVKACKNKEINIGKVFIFEENGKTIINFPTKANWREKAKIEYIESGLKSLKNEIIQRNIKSIAIPPLGCGNGGLNWKDVKSLIETYLSDLSNNTSILIYEPINNFQSSQKISRPPKISVSHYIFLEVMNGLKIKSELKFHKELIAQKAIFFLIFFSKKEFFKFESYKFGPYCHPVEIVRKEVTEYFEFHGYKKTKKDGKKISELMLKEIASKKNIEKIEKIKNYIPMACEFCNSMKDIKQLEVVATILHILVLHNKMSADDIVSFFLQKYPKKHPQSYDKKNILENIKWLISKKILKEDLFKKIYY
ncbi:Appr-1-p processing protein [Campylobacter lari]|nr:Appr-1-p processing protein [Campylobacter lari]